MKQTGLLIDKLLLINILSVDSPVFVLRKLKYSIEISIMICYIFNKDCT